MNLNTLYQRFVYFSIVIVIFVMVIGFLDATHLFGPSYGMGVTTAGKSSMSVFESFITSASGLDTGLASLWLLAIGTGFGGSAVLAYLTGSPVPLAIAGLGTVFWTAYIHAHTILAVFVPMGFLLMIDVVMIFLFVAAIYGILGGTG